MRPKEIDQRAVRIRLLVGMVVVPAMHSDPECRRALQGAYAENRQRVLDPSRTVEAAMGQKAMKADIDAEHAENKKAREGNRDAAPAEEPGHEGQQRQQVVKAKGASPTPHEGGRVDTGWNRQPRRTGCARRGSMILGWAGN